MNDELGGLTFGMAIGALFLGLVALLGVFAIDCRVEDLEDWRRESECRESSDEAACLRDLLEDSR